MNGVATRLSSDRGSASLEFITVGLVLLVPVVYLVLTFAALEAGAFATEGAARQAARVFSSGETVAEASVAADRAVDFALADHGLPVDSASVEIRCAPDPDACLTRRGLVTVTVRTVVPIPLAPPVLDLDVGLAMPLEATATRQVSLFTEAEQ